MGVCLCYRRRKLTRHLLLVGLLSFSVCLTLLSYLQSDLDDKNYSNQFRLSRDLDQRTVSGQREILHFEQAQNVSEAKGRASEIPSDYQSHSTVILGGDTTQTAAVLVSEAIEQTTCDGPWPQYPDCEDKINWMTNNWQKDPCYSHHGVDGTRCSIQHYLSTIEHWCPPQPGRTVGGTKDCVKAKIIYDIQPLLDAINVNPKFNWISRRIQSMWSLWKDALGQLERVKPFNHTRKQILVHIGALSEKSGFKLAENADHGGPLGELVQWSDLIATLHLLGHTLHFSTEHTKLKEMLPPPPAEVSKLGGCPTGDEDRYQAIFTDIVGLKQFKKAVKNQLQHYQCLFRVLDSFGTEPQFNFAPWKSSKSYRKQIWGNWGLNPRQFMTMYPHSPDNSFLGFVVGSNRTNSQPPYKKKEIGLVYGKELYMWQGHHDYLDTISKFLDIHATIGTTKQKNQQFDMSIVPGFVNNHGILDHDTLTTLLQETRVFIGLGFPYEGPAPLEAIASGCYFLNPRFNPPLNRDNTKFFKDKPTLRALSSQNPYTELFIGKPYVYTVDILNREEVESALREILSHENPPPHIPYEYTHEGMLERVSVYLEYQDFCSHDQWPPQATLETRLSNEGESCKDACYRQGLLCEPELFPLLNNKNALARNNVQCSQVVNEHSAHGPSIHLSTNRCSLQSHMLLLSCVGSEIGTQRLCPCRTYKRGQVALCSECVR